MTWRKASSSVTVHILHARWTKSLFHWPEMEETDALRGEKQ